MPVTSSPSQIPTTPGRRTPLDVDPTWRRLYLVGGFSSWLYVVLAVVVAGIMSAAVDEFWDIIVDGHRLLGFISDGHELYWHLLQGLVLMTSILLIITFVAASIALLPIDRTLAVLGGIFLVVSQMLFMAYYPVLLGMVYLAGEYESATAAGRDDLATSAEALIAQNSGFNPAYEVLMASGALLLALAMLKAGTWRWSAYLGAASFVAVIAGMALYPVIGIGYLFWWGVFVLWLLVIGWDLVRLGRGGRNASRAPRHADP